MSPGDELLDAALADPTARFLLFRGEDVLLEGTEPVLVPLADLTIPAEALSSAVLVGYEDEAPRLALDVSDLGEESDEFSPPSGRFRSLRRLKDPIDLATWGFLARARALLEWHRTHPACPVCGAPTRSEQGGKLRVCTACEEFHYPRTDPSVIVRVVRDERCLLARQPRFAPRVRSVIAGFVEPGESLEETVRREVLEEVGIRVGRTTYLGSQPWPFPMSLMVAFEAEALTDEIRLGDEELEAADWYTREQVRENVDAGTLILPSLKSIARRMIEEWLKGSSAV